MRSLVFFGLGAALSITPIRASSDEGMASARCHAEVPEAQSLVLVTPDRLSLRAGRHVVQAEIGDATIAIAVPQPDYGEVVHLDMTQSGQIAVVGQQISYLLDISQNGESIDVSKTEVPIFYQTACEGFKRFMGDCQPSGVYFSDTLKAFFTEGYDEQGIFRSLMLGFRQEPVDMTVMAFPHYVGDGQPGTVILQGDGGRAVYNGIGEPVVCDESSKLPLAPQQ